MNETFATDETIYSRQMRKVWLKCFALHACIRYQPLTRMEQLSNSSQSRSSHAALWETRSCQHEPREMTQFNTNNLLQITNIINVGVLAIKVIEFLPVCQASNAINYTNAQCSAKGIRVRENNLRVCCRLPTTTYSDTQATKMHNTLRKGPMSMERKQSQSISMGYTSGSISVVYLDSYTMTVFSTRRDSNTIKKWSCNQNIMNI